MPWGTVRLGTTLTGLSHRLGDLLRGHDHVLVVGQDDDLVGRGRLHRLEQVLGGRVHRLAALDHAGAELLEDALEAVAHGHRDDADVGRLDRPVPLLSAPAVGSPARGRSAPLVVLGQDLVVLPGHVLDLQLLQGPVGGGAGDQAAGVEGVDVDPDQRVVADDHRRVAHRRELVANLVEGALRSLDQELGAEAPALLRGLQGVGADLDHGPRRRRGRGRARLADGLRIVALDRLEEALEDHHQAVAAGVDHPASRSRQLARGLVHRPLRRRHHGLDQLGDVLGLLGRATAASPTLRATVRIVPSVGLVTPL